MDGGAWLTQRTALVDRFLDARLPPASEPPTALHAAMRHLVFPSGKRLRPAFVFAGCEAVGGTAELALPARVHANRVFRKQSRKRQNLCAGRALLVRPV